MEVQMEKETEIHLLRHRLNLQHDMWMSDKLLHEQSENIHKERELTLAYEIARLNLIHGVHQNEALLHKVKLEYALDDLEILEMRSEVLKLGHIEDQAKAQEYVRSLKRKIRMIGQQIAQKTLEVEQKNLGPQKPVEELERKHCNEIVKPKSDHGRIDAMRENELSPVLGEKDFISVQLKQMEDDYCNRMRGNDQQIQVACESIEKQHRTLNEQKTAKHARDFKLNGMQFEKGEYARDVKVLEEYAWKISRENESSQGLKYAMHELKEANDIQVKERYRSSENVTSDINAKNEFPQQYPVQQQLCLHGQDFNTKPGTLSEANALMLFEDRYLEELKKTSAMLDIAHLENENLRMLNAEMEAELKHNKMRSKPDSDIKMRKRGSVKIPAENHDNEVFKLNASDSTLKDFHAVEIKNLRNSKRNKRKAETDMLDLQAVSDSEIIQSDKSTSSKRQNRRPDYSGMLKASPRSRQCFSDVKKSTQKTRPITVNFFSAAFNVPKVKAP